MPKGPDLDPTEWGIIIEALENFTDNKDHRYFGAAGIIIDRILASPAGQVNATEEIAADLN